MEQTKQKLSLLINRITDFFPDENDLKGFLGISKALMIDVLKESDSLLAILKEHDSHFNTIILKRELSDLFNKLQKDLEGEFDKIKPAQFNSILTRIARIKFLTKETYIAVAESQPIRTEAQILKANEELNSLTSNIEELKRINVDLTALKNSTTQNITNFQEEVRSLKESAEVHITSKQNEATTSAEKINAISEKVKSLETSATTIVTDFEIKQKTAIENEQKINDFLTKVEAHKSAIEAIDKNTTLWEAEIKKAKEDIKERSVEYDSLTEKSKAIQEEIEATHEKIFGKEDEDGNIIKGYFQETEELKNKIASFLGEQEKKFQAQFTHIESLLPGATSVGLAKAFEEQRKKYNWPIWIWTGVFILVTTIMAVCSGFLFYYQLFKPLQAGEQTLTQGILALMKDIPFYIPTIWLALFASKQQSQYKRLQQEYVFKEINAKSFYGHKKQIEELIQNGVTDNNLLLKLVAQLIAVTSQNPSETLDNKSHNDSPPILTLIENLLPSKKEGQKAGKEHEIK